MRSFHNTFMETKRGVLYMKLLFFTDTHIRGTTPKNRKDNLTETLEEKFLEVIKLAEIHKVDYILHGGDLFDRPDISPSIVRRFAIILRKFNAPIYAIAGNHDTFGHNPNTIHRTMLGIFDAINLINIIGREETIILEKNNIKVQLTGQPYVYDLDSDPKRSGYIIDRIENKVDYSIHMVHGMLLNKPFIEGIPYTLVDDIDKTKADITLSGHYHSGFGVVTKNDKYFINPGSLIRITNSLREIDRTPKIVLIDFSNGINVDMIPLNTAKPGKEVLDRKQIELSMFRKEKINKFKQSIDETSSFNKLDINHILEGITINDGVSKEIKEEAIRRITQAQMSYREDEN